MKNLCERLGIKQIRTTPYHPQSNGAVERMHGTLVPIHRKLVSKDLPWNEQVKFALYAIRATPNASTGYAPVQIIHGRMLRSPLDVVIGEIDPVQCKNVKAVEWLEELGKRVKVIKEEVEANVKRAQKERKERHDKKAVTRKFEIGNQVLTRVPGLRSKLEGSWEGPFVVLDVPSEFHVVLGTPGKATGKAQGKRVHINSCKPFVQASLHRVAVWATEDELLEQQPRLLGEVLSQVQRKELEEVLAKWECVLSDAPGMMELLVHHINTGDAPPVRAAPYQVPLKWQEAVEKEIKLLKDMGILVPSSSPWGSPLAPVAKKDGGVRVCVDFRRVNKLTVKDPYHIPLVQEIVERVGKACVLSKLDLSKCFYQVRMAECDQEKTAVVTQFGKLEFKRMPFGLVNATSTFQRLMDRVLEGMAEYCSAYVDDILVYSSDWKTHLVHLDLVLGKLKEAGLTAKASKCEWGKSRLCYLGHKIGGGRVAVPEDMVTNVKEFIRPTTKKGIRAFLGTCGYYRKYVKDFGTLAQPLTKMTRKAEPEKVQWTPEGEQAFVMLRESLCNRCMLTIPTVLDSFRLHTDASGVGLGAVLSVIRDNKELPAAYYSRQLKGPERRYSATELECLAVVMAIKHFEIYLAGQRFELVTDHLALKGLRSSTNHNRRLTRWCLFLQEFDFVVTYRPGPENTNADGLSRQCWTWEDDVDAVEGTTPLGEGKSQRRGRCGNQPQT